MKITNRIRPFVLGRVLFAAAVGFALTSSGCVVDGCQSDLFVDWQIQTATGAPVTCDGAGAATVVITIDGAEYRQICPAGYSYGSRDIPLQSNYAGYNVTVNLYDSTGTQLAPTQTSTVSVTSCASYQTAGPAPLVVQVSSTQ
ncbi:MAG TPA: hypothetical protein VI456_07750 [Polyangia bacterium]